MVKPTCKVLIGTRTHGHHASCNLPANHLRQGHRVCVFHHHFRGVLPFIATQLGRADRDMPGYGMDQRLTTGQDSVILTRHESNGREHEATA